MGVGGKMEVRVRVGVSSHTRPGGVLTGEGRRAEPTAPTASLIPARNAPRTTQRDPAGTPRGGKRRPRNTRGRGGLTAGGQAAAAAAATAATGTAAAMLRRVRVRARAGTRMCASPEAPPRRAWCEGGPLWCEVQSFSQVTVSVTHSEIPAAARGREALTGSHRRGGTRAQPLSPPIASA